MERGAAAKRRRLILFSSSSADLSLEILQHAATSLVKERVPGSSDDDDQAQPLRRQITCHETEPAADTSRNVTPPARPAKTVRLVGSDPGYEQPTNGELRKSERRGDKQTPKARVVKYLTFSSKHDEAQRMMRKGKSAPDPDRSNNVTIRSVIRVALEYVMNVMNEF